MMVEHRQNIPCANCEAVSFDGWQDGGAFICQDCWQKAACILCGKWRRPKPVHQSCRSCRIELSQLSSKEKDVLVRINEMIPLFSVEIWENGKQVKNQSVRDQPALVFPGILLGDLDDAKDISKLLHLDVGAVLNLCSDDMGKDHDLPRQLLQVGMHYLGLSAKDNRHFDFVGQILPSACDFIESQLQCGRIVLVHCLSGINRSVAAVVGFLVLRKGQDIITAIESVMKVRGRVLTNRSFRRQLARVALNSKRKMRREIRDRTNIRPWNDHTLGSLCCKRRRLTNLGQPEMPRKVVSVIGGVGHALHGLCLQFQNGERLGLFLNDDNSCITDLSNDSALRERNAVWHNLGLDEFIVKVEGHRMWPRKFLAAELVLYVLNASSGETRQIIFRGPEDIFKRQCWTPFNYCAQAEHAIIELLFDRKETGCSGVRETRLNRSAAASIVCNNSARPSNVAGTVKRIIFGVGHVVHGMCLVHANGERFGIFLEDAKLADGCRACLNLVDDEALIDRNATWVDLKDEYLTKVSGHRSRIGFLAANVTFRTSVGRIIEVRGQHHHFDRHCSYPFSFAAQEGYEITELLFDQTIASCIGIRENAVHL